MEKRNPPFDIRLTSSNGVHHFVPDLILVELKDPPVLVWVQMTATQLTDPSRGEGKLETAQEVVMAE